MCILTFSFSPGGAESLLTKCDFPSLGGWSHDPFVIPESSAGPKAEPVQSKENTWSFRGYTSDDLLHDPQSCHIAVENED